MVPSVVPSPFFPHSPLPRPRLTAKRPTPSCFTRWAPSPAPVAGELVTPTGAAIVTALRTSDQLPSRYRIEAVGYGAGKRPYEGCSGTLRCLLVHADA